MAVGSSSSSEQTRRKWRGGWPACSGPQSGEQGLCAWGTSGVRVAAQQVSQELGIRGFHSGLKAIKGTAVCAETVKNSRGGGWGGGRLAQAV